MSPILAVELWIVTAVVLGGLSTIALVLIVVAPWQTIREEPPLDEDVQARLLLGEDPERIAEDEDAEEVEEMAGPDERAGQAEPTGPAA